MAIARDILALWRSIAAPEPAARPIVIRFVTCGDRVSAIIRRGELGFWASHVEALTPDGLLLGARRPDSSRRLLGPPRRRLPVHLSHEESI